MKFPNYWNFRGQTQDWKLKTSIEVLLDDLGHNYDWHIDERTNFRQEFIDKFKIATQKELKSYECLALMQHYGLRTELLDVTQEIKIALYFAVDKDKDKDGVIWAFNLAQLYKNNIENGLVKNINLTSSEYVQFAYRSELITEIGKLTNFVCDLGEPILQNLTNIRKQRQKGRFLWAPNFHKSNSNSLWSYSNSFCGFENALFYSYRMNKTNKKTSTINTLNYDAINGDKLIKFIIPKNIKKNCLSQLEQLGISNDFLLPPDSKEDICNKILQDFLHRETYHIF